MNLKKITLVVVLVLIVVSIAYLESTKPSATPLVTSSSQTTPTQRNESTASGPELTGITGYINAPEGLQLKDLRGKVVLVDFWTYTCINCIRTLPHLIEWDRKYREKGLVIVGVHTPEFEFEKKRENVEMAIEKYGITYPVVQDNDYATWRAFGNRYWPRKYLFDAAGNIRYDHIGEGAYAETELKIQELLAEIGTNVSDMELSTVEDTTPRRPTTPELYAGYEFALPRGQNIGNQEGLQPEKTVNYELPGGLKKNIIYLRGLWKSNSDTLEAVADQTSVFLDFTGHSVNIVADSLMNNSVQIEVIVNNQSISPNQAGSDVQFEDGRAFIMVNEPRLYTVVRGEYGEYVLELKTKEGFTFSAFTFG